MSICVTCLSYALINYIARSTRGAARIDSDNRACRHGRFLCGTLFRARYYATLNYSKNVELLDNPDLKGKPFAVRPFRQCVPTLFDGTTRLGTEF